jgi:hypothetical protein
LQIQFIAGRAGRTFQDSCNGLKAERIISRVTMSLTPAVIELDGGPMSALGQ